MPTASPISASLLLTVSYCLTDFCIIDQCLTAVSLPLLFPFYVPLLHLSVRVASVCLGHRRSHDLLLVSLVLSIFGCILFALTTFIVTSLVLWNSINLLPAVKLIVFKLYCRVNNPVSWQNFTLLNTWFHIYN